MQRFVLVFIVLIGFSTVQTVNAQTATRQVTSRDQLWMGYYTQTRFSKRWGFWFDAHYRWTDNFADRPYQLLIRPALIYYVSDNVRLNAGYAFLNNYPAAGLHTSRPENRLWQQITWTEKHSWFGTQQWLRLEERFNRTVTNDVLQKGTTYTWRARYDLGIFIPLKGKEIVAKTPFISVMNEIFINFGKNIVYNTFDQNRFFAGLGYQFTAHLNAQLGYMNVFQQAASGNKYTSSNVIRLYVYHTFDLRKKISDAGS